MSSPHQLDYLQEHSDPEYRARIEARAAKDAALEARAVAAFNQTNAAAESSYNGQTPAEIIEANARRRKEIHKQIDSIACPDCKKMARILEVPTYKCTNCRQKPHGGSKRKSKSQRRKKSKSQRRRKSIKRRH